MLMEIDWNAVLKPNVIGTFMALLVPIVGCLAMAWYRIEKTKSENSLKKTLVDRGMKADEIERILAAKGPKDE